jgi:hypothetical protein
MGAHTQKLAFQARKMEYRNEVARNHPRLQGRQMPPEIAAFIGRFLSDVWAFTGGVLTISTIGVVQTGLAIGKVDAAEIVLKAAGWSAGLVALGRLVMSDPVTFWWEQFGDGLIDTILAFQGKRREEPEEEDDYIPPEATVRGTNEATVLYRDARDMYNLAHDVLAAEWREGVKSRTKSWSKRQVWDALQIDQEAWSRAIALWIEAGIVEEAGSIKLLTTSKNMAAAQLRNAMANRGYVEFTPRGTERGNGIFMPKE